MTEKTYPVPADFAGTSRLSPESYASIYAASINDPESFWGTMGQRLDWVKNYKTVKNVSWDKNDLYVKWYEDGILNVTENCLDRQLEKRADKTAIIWEPDNPNSKGRKLTYRELHGEVCRFANVMKKHGAKKGDRITIYMPMIVEAAVAMLACARIGAIHSVVFGGFSPEALAGRITDCDSTFVITADEGLRGTRKVPLKANCDAACALAIKDGASIVKTVLTVRHTEGDVQMVNGRDVWLDEALIGISSDCAPEPMSAEEPLFILYTSGSTGKPKGAVSYTHLTLPTTPYV